MSQNDCLIWVGSSYPTVHSFVAEAKRQGCSRKIPSWPAWLVPGESRVFLAHRGGLRSVDCGVIFGYCVAAGVDLVSPRSLLIEHHRLWRRFADSDAKDPDTTPLKQFWADRVPGGVPLEFRDGQSAGGAQGSRRRGREEDQRGRRTTRDDLRDDLIDLIVDVLFDCGGEAPLPPGGRLVSTFQTSLGDERECGFRLRESGTAGAPRTRPGVYIVDPVARAIDDILCELLKELIAEELKRDERVRRGGAERVGEPPDEDPAAWEAIDELRANLEREARAQSRGRRLRKGSEQFDKAVETALARFAARSKTDQPAQIPPVITGRASRETPGLVVFETPYPRFRRVPDASFRGLIRVNGDELLEGIAESYASDSRTLVRIPYLYVDPEEIEEGASRTFADLTALLATRCQSSKRLAEGFLRSFVSLVQNELAADHRLSVPGLGSFVLQDRAARTGRHPQTRERIEIPATKVVRFRPAKDLKDRIR